MTSLISARSLPRRLWLATLALLVGLAGAVAFFAVLAGRSPPALEGSSSVDSAVDDASAVDDGFDASDDAASEALALRVAQRNQQALGLTLALALCIPLASAVGVGLLFAGFVLVRRLAAYAGRRTVAVTPVAAADHAKSNQGRRAALSSIGSIFPTPSLRASAGI